LILTKSRGRRPLDAVDLGHVRVEIPASLRASDRDAMVAVLDEVHVADPVDGDRRHRLAPALRLGDSLPAVAHPPRGRSEAAVELA